MDDLTQAFEQSSEATRKKIPDRTVVYDLEILKAIPDRKSPPIEGVQYCEGWHDHGNMGVSVLCAYDYYSGRYRVFTESNKEEFFHLIDSAELVVGFNSVKFDDKVVEKSWAYQYTNPRYDILREIWIANGLDPVSFGREHNGFGLDAMCKANIPGCVGKTGNGALAPADWQKGKYGDVIDYCLEDVRLTKELFEILALTGSLICPKTGRYILMRSPALRA